METHDGIILDRGWGIALVDLEIDAERVLNRAGLSAEALQRESGRISVSEYFRLITAIGAESDEPDFPIRLATAYRAEGFHPLFFAALCADDLAEAMRRIARYKRSVLPMRFFVDESEDALEISWEWADSGIELDPFMVGMELVFKVHVARLGTRHRVEPLRVCSPVALDPRTPFEDYFGVAPTSGVRAAITFRRDDAERVFLSRSEPMWQALEPVLSRSLGPSSSPTVSLQVREVLMRCLPSGEPTLEVVARRLGMSGRTLQRRLREDGSRYREVLRRVRHELADHYLKNTDVAYEEIAFLLGFFEPTSFFRAYRRWADATPQAVRRRSD